MNAPKNINLTFGNIVTSATLLVAVGIWVGGIEAKQDFHDKLDSIESELLVWLDDAEKAQARDHKDVMAILNRYGEKITYIDMFLNTKYPNEYIIPEKSKQIYTRGKHK